MNKIKTFSQFIFEGTSQILSKSKNKGISDFFRYMDSPQRKQLEGAGRLTDLSFQEIENPIKPGVIENYLTFSFSDISDPIPYPFVVYDPSSDSIDLKTLTKKEVFEYFPWVERKIQNVFFDVPKMDHFYDSVLSAPKHYIAYGASMVIECYYDKYKRETQFLNISDGAYQNLPEYKDLIKTGWKETTSPRRLKGGTISMSNPAVWGEYTIHSNGYIRRQGVDRAQVISKSPEANKPIETLDDLAIKFRILYLYTLKNDILKNAGIDSKTIKMVMDSMLNPSDPAYKDVYDKLVRMKPQLSLYLVQPAEGYNQKMIRGAKLLRSLNIF